MHYRKLKIITKIRYRKLSNKLDLLMIFVKINHDKCIEFNIFVKVNDTAYRERKIFDESMIILSQSKSICLRIRP